MRKLTKEQLKKLVVKERKLIEQAGEIEPLICERIYDSVLDGINAAVVSFVGTDEVLEEFVSDYIYRKNILDSVLDDTELMRVISGHVENKIRAIIESNREEMMNIFDSEKSDVA